MNKNEFLHIIQQPVAILSMDENKLQRLIEKYPYSSPLHLIYLKKLQTLNNPQFNTQLSISSASMPDRKRLYLFLKEDLQPVISLKEEVVDEIVVDELPAIEEPQNENSVILLSEEIASNISDKVFIEEQEPKADPKEQLEEPVELPEVSQEPLSPQEILMLRLAEIQAKNSTAVPEPVLESNPFVTECQIEPHVPDLQIHEPKEEKNNLDIEILDEDLKELEKQYTPTYALPEILPEELPIKRKENLPEKIEMFQSFINRRKEATQKAKFFKPQEIAEKSLLDESDLVTETLAKIYEKQGHWQKAISVYEKLCLKFPKKSSYFAMQIQRLEDCNNVKP